MKFPQTYCSQCAGEFGPGDCGFSHCRDHIAIEEMISDIREFTYDASHGGGFNFDMTNTEAISRVRQFIKQVRE